MRRDDERRTRRTIGSKRFSRFVGVGYSPNSFAVIVSSFVALLTLLDLTQKDAKQFKMYKTEGNNCFKADRFEDAIAWYDKAMAAANSQAEISVLYCNRAQCQLKLKDYAEALKSCNKAVELNAKNEKAMYRSMLAHSYLGQLDEAIRAGERTLQMNPRNEPAIKCLEELRQRVKKGTVH